MPEGLTVDFFRASSYGSGTVSGGSVALNLDGMRSEVEGRHIIVVREERRWGRGSGIQLRNQARCRGLARGPSMHR